MGSYIANTLMLPINVPNKYIVIQTIHSIVDRQFWSVHFNHIFYKWWLFLLWNNKIAREKLVYLSCESICLMTKIPSNLLTFFSQIKEIFIQSIYQDDTTALSEPGLWYPPYTHPIRSTGTKRKNIILHKNEKDDW